MFPHFPLWLSAALAMSLALLVMILTGTTHPPGAKVEGDFILT